MSAYDDLRQRVAVACRVLGRLDLTGGATGHVSARIPNTDRILIRARGPGEIGVRYTKLEQIVEVNFDGELTGSNRAGLKSPQEVFIHTETYRSRPDISAVVHIHPPTVVLFTICGKPLLPIYGAFDPASAQLALEGLPTYPRSVLVNTPALGAELAETMGKSKACLMHGHGITTVGQSVEEAALHAIGLNELATMNYRAYQLGEPRPISTEDQEVIRRMGKREAPTEPGGRPGGRVATEWRYYCTLTDAS